MTRCLLTSLLLAALAAPPARASNCAGDSTGMTAITDLGPGLYKGVPGGLYPGSSNHRPAAHNSAGLGIATSIAPLDTLGNVDFANGQVVLISIGLSNTTQEFSAFVPKATADPLKQPRCRAIDCARGGQTASLIATPSASYWDTVSTRLRGAGSSPLQAQVAWLKTANANPTGDFATTSESLYVQLRRIVNILHARLPNLKLVYFTSRIYAGYASSTLNPEPYAYESGFSIRKLIAAQISGDPGLNFDPAHGAIVSPWLAWGPYLWADGLRGRSDGLTWSCSDFVATDGTHPSASGRDKVADSLLVFFENDETTMPWYRRTLVAGVPPTPAVRLSLRATPNPANTFVDFAIASPGGAWQLRVADVQGRTLRSFANGPTNATRVHWDLRDDAGRRLPPGTYFASLAGTQGAVHSRVVVR